MQVTLGYETIPGVGDPDFLDRLADLLYAIDELVDPLLFLNEDGSITASFDIEARDPVEAVSRAADLFFGAFVVAEPLRAPTSAELEAANRLAGVAAEQARAAGRLVGGQAATEEFLASVNATSERRPTSKKKERVPA